MSLRAGAALAALLGLAGCASLPPPAAPAGDPDAGAAAQRLRLQALGLGEDGDCAAPAWRLSARVALANGRQGGSGRLDWSQGAGQLHLQLSAPVTRQGWALDVDAGGATLRGLEGGPRQAADAAGLLRDATGWDIPLAALGCWLRGAQAPAAAFGPARISYAPDLLPRRIEQAGWVVEYAGWAPGALDGPALPLRIEASRGENRVRLVVDAWGGRDD